MNAIPTSNITPVTDDEILLRHVPGGTTWLAPGPRITSANFRPRSHLGETSISVNRLEFTTPDELISRMGGDRSKNSHVIWAYARDVRALGLLVESTPMADDPGHASIHSGPTLDLLETNTQRSLSKLFQFEETMPQKT